MCLRVIRRGADVTQILLNMVGNLKGVMWVFPDLESICLKWGQVAAPIEASVGFMSSSGRESEIFISGHLNITFMGF